MEIKIRKATIDDVEHLAKVHYNSFHAANRDLRSIDFLSQLSLPNFTKRWQQRLTADVTLTLVAEINYQIVGLTCFTLTPEKIPSQCDVTSAEILLLYIDPFYFRKGIGRTLYLTATDFIRKSGSKQIFIWSAFNNPTSNAFYKAIGATMMALSEKSRN